VIGPPLLLLTVLADRQHGFRPPHEATWLRAGDTRLRAVQAGAGDTTLLLLHGFAESLFTWRALVDPLALQYRVLAVDLPGFGGSDKPDSGYSLDAMTGRLSDLLDRETRGPVIVVGHSMGGEIAATLALRRPDRISAAVLIAPAGWDVGLGGIADTMYAGKAAAIGWYLSSRAFLLPEHDPDWLAEPATHAGYTVIGDPAYRRSTALVLQQFDFRSLRDRFAEIRQPVLLLWGGLDPVIPVEFADSISGRLPCVRRVLFPGALHRPQVEIPDRTLGAILPFLRSPSCP
jgi:pimeloyl-ACP methyl ester carboxylesterase